MTVSPVVSAKYRDRKGLLQVAVASFLIGCFTGGSLQNMIGSRSTSSSSTSTSSPRDYNNNGWHSIEVFYGKTDHYETKHGITEERLWYGQVSQDELVYNLFRKKRNGFFVDLAAFDGIMSSNSYSLETRLGWTGICIEPNPQQWSNLAYRSCQVVGAVAGKTRMEQVFFKFDEQNGGIAADGFDNDKESQVDAEPRYTVTLREIFERFNAPRVIDYLSLDVEGAEGYIMESFPLDYYKVLVMTIERPKDFLKTLLVKNGYVHLKDLSDWGETIWAHESILKSLDLTFVES